MQVSLCMHFRVDYPEHLKLFDVSEQQVRSYCSEMLDEEWRRLDRDVRIHLQTSILAVPALVQVSFSFFFQGTFCEGKGK